MYAKTALVRTQEARRCAGLRMLYLVTQWRYQDLLLPVTRPVTCYDAAAADSVCEPCDAPPQSLSPICCSSIECLLPRLQARHSFEGLTRCVECGQAAETLLQCDLCDYRYCSTACRDSAWDL